MYRQNLNIGAAMRDREAIRRDEVSKSNDVAKTIMDDIDTATEKIKAEMTEKYGKQF